MLENASNLKKDITNYVPINNYRDLFVLEVSYRKTQHSVHKRKMAKSYYAFHLVLSGSGVLVTPEKTYTVKEGDLFIRFPSEPIQYFDDEKNPWSYVFITFMGINVDNFFSRLGISPSNRVFKTNDEITKLFIDSVILTNKYSDGMDIIANAHLLSIFSQLSISHCESKPTPPNDVSNYITKALEYIEPALYDGNLHAEDVASYLGLNVDYFLRIFKQRLKTPFSKYIVARRMNKATELIAKGQTNVSVISDSVGYNSPSYFIQSFKKLFGLTPSDYIKKELHVKKELHD